MKIQELSLKKRKLILWVIIIVVAALLFSWWGGNVIKTLQTISLPKVPEELNLPTFEGIKIPEYGQTTTGQ
ncbi:MAG: hypothetical protein Q8P55_00125 [bacterium]|nr:hypothetical protein [bacterium]